MQAELYAAPWTKSGITPELEEAIEILGNDVWREAALRFYAENDAARISGSRQQKGMQKTLNAILKRKFENRGWIAHLSYFVKERSWVRVTFRHQMSIGSDFLDALKVCKKQGIEVAAILAADAETLRVISPNDCGAIVSYEKLLVQVEDLNGAMDIPLYIGKLTPASRPSPEIERELKRERKRDITVPRK